MTFLQKNGHLTKDRDGISIFKDPGFQRPGLSNISQEGSALAAQCDCKQQFFYYSCCPKLKSSAMQLDNGKLVTPANKAFHFCYVLFFIITFLKLVECL